MKKWLSVALGGLLASLFLVHLWAGELPKTPYRRHIWAARQAWEQRNYKTAEKELDAFKELGMPDDPLVRQADCPIQAEVKALETAVTVAQTCLTQRKRIKFWRDPVRAKIDILGAFEKNDPNALAFYLDCGLQDLTIQPSSCPVHLALDAGDLQRFVQYVHDNKDIYERPNWREFPQDKDDLTKDWLRYKLYTYSDHWLPCAMPGAPLLGLRQDPDGSLRIASFAASCLN